MLKVSEILQLSLFKEFKNICGEEYMSNTVSGAVILEYESIKNNYTGFGYGDFVLASYFFAKDNPEFVHTALSCIIKRHVSGIAIKISQGDTIPQSIQDLACENHIPIFTFINEYTEDLIISISESLKTKAQYIVFEEKLNTILTEHLTPIEVKNTALEINPDFLPYIITANITSKDSQDNIAIHSYFKKLMYRQYRNDEACTYSFIKYNYGIVLVCSFTKDSLPDYGTHYNYVSSLLNNVEFNPENFYIGICDTPMLLSELNISAAKAIDANIVCEFKQSDSKIYSNIGVFKYIMSIVNNPALYKDIIHQIQLIKDYDETYASNLLDTLIVYISNNGDIPKTSNEIFQHANTVRYRIKKASSILALSSEHSYEEMYIIINWYLLSQTLHKEI